MVSLQCTRTIAAPVGRVFETFTDLRNAPKRVPAILRLEVLTEGPIGKGTRFRETRKMFGKEATEEMEITEFDRDRSYSVAASSCGALYATRFDFRPEGQGTRVDFVFSATPTTFFAKLFSPLMKIMVGPMKKLVEDDLTSLAQWIEGSAGSNP